MQQLVNTRCFSINAIVLIGKARTRVCKDALLPFLSVALSGRSRPIIQASVALVKLHLAGTLASLLSGPGHHNPASVIGCCVDLHISSIPLSISLESRPHLHAITFTNYTLPLCTPRRWSHQTFREFCSRYTHFVTHLTSYVVAHSVLSVLRRLASTRNTSPALDAFQHRPQF